MKKFWIIFVSLLLCAVIGVGIWHGIVYGDKIKVFAEETWQKIESAFKKDNVNSDDLEEFEESQLNGVYYFEGYHSFNYISIQGMESEEPMFMYLSAIASDDCVYLCHKYKSNDLHHNVYSALVKEYEDNLIKFYLDDSLLLCYDATLERFVDCDGSLIPIKKFVSIKTAHELTPQVVVEENKVSLINDFAFSSNTYLYRLSGGEEWSTSSSYDFDTLVQAGLVSVGDVCEVKVLCGFNCCDDTIESDVVEFVVEDPHPNGYCVYDWEIVREATCCEEGYKVGTCEICGDVVESVISITAHSYVLEPVVDGLPGEYQSVCSFCGHVLSHNDYVVYS